MFPFSTPPMHASGASATIEDLEPKGEIPRWLLTFEEELDRRIMVSLRDGRTLVGYLRTFDQYGSIAMEDVREILTSDNYFAEVMMGGMIIRGENIVLFGELEADELKLNGLVPAPLCEVLRERAIMEKEGRLVDTTHLDVFDLQ